MGTIDVWTRYKTSVWNVATKWTKVKETILGVGTMGLIVVIAFTRLFFEIVFMILGGLFFFFIAITEGVGEYKPKKKREK